MNYLVHYDLLIAKHGFKEKPADVYVENHHILPKCLGGLNNRGNLIYLKADAHYVAHQLLVKMHPSHAGLIYAAMMMGTCSVRHQRSANKMYQWLRKRYSIAMKGIRRAPMSPEQKANLSKIRKLMVGWKHREETKLKIGAAQKGELNHMFGKTLTPEHRAKISAGGKGLKRSDETRAKISEAQKGNTKGAARKGMKNTPEAIENMRKARLKYLESLKHE